MHAEQRWQLYVDLRENVRHLLAGKVPAQEIWRIVSFNFPPLDGSPHEVKLTKNLAEYINTDVRGVLDANRLSIPFEDVAAITAPPTDDEPWLDGDIDAPPPVAVAPKPVPATLGEIPINPPPLPVDDKGWTIYARLLTNNATSAAASAAKRDEVWAKLAHAVDLSKRCPVITGIDWIYQNAGTPPELIKPEDVPSPAALWHLRELQTNPSAYTEFLKTIVPRLMPDKKQAEFESKRSQGSLKVFEMLDAFDEQFDADSAA